MLIVNDDHRRLAGVASLEEQCKYCGSAFAEYPLIQSDDADQTVYHATCAVELATEIMVDLFTFFRPPAPYTRLFVLSALDAIPDASQESTSRGGPNSKEVKNAVNQRAPDEVGHSRSSIHWLHGCELSNRTCGCH